MESKASSKSSLKKASSSKDKKKAKEDTGKHKDKTEEECEDSSEEGKGKDGFWSKRKRGVASSGLGKALIEQQLDKESKTLIKVLCEMVAVTHDKKTAELIKKYIFKVAAKTVLLLQDGKLSAEQFQSLRGSFRRICSSVRNGYLVTKSLTPETANRIAQIICQFGGGVRSLVKPFLSTGSLDKIDFLLSIFGSEEFLMKASKVETFDSVAMVLSHYLLETN
eukprot:TRINITY_DN17173_c0_g1_i1.p1 TRINITY_DN17173_c0_g1~~TRINITY_DN17173_c0_g1_i1.p1  ORF type:complete len:222 (+),score=46.91 TRINITY_DN17173_c0_g1_i1:38-703(+)